MKKILYCVLIVLLLLLCLSIQIKIAQAFWFWGGERTVEVRVVDLPVKTIEGEIDRLSALYNVSSSTVRAVAQCESSMYGGATHKNVDKDGIHWSTDFGLLMVNDYFHESRMIELGLDIRNEFDSLEYGIMLMAEQGLSPWKASRSCWLSKI